MFNQEERTEIVESVMETVTDYPDPDEIDDGDVVEVTVFIFRRNGKVTFAHGNNIWSVNSDGLALIDWLNAQVKPIVDHRKVTDGGQYRIGSVSIRGDGEIVGAHIDEEFKKPSEQADSDA